MKTLSEKVKINQIHFCFSKSTRESKFKRWYIAGNIAPKASATMLSNPTTALRDSGMRVTVVKVRRWCCVNFAIYLTIFTVRHILKFIVLVCTEYLCMNHLRDLILRFESCTSDECRNKKAHVSGVRRHSLWERHCYAKKVFHVYRTKMSQVDPEVKEGEREHSSRPGDEWLLKTVSQLRRGPAIALGGVRPFGWPRAPSLVSPVKVTGRWKTSTRDCV